MESRNRRLRIIIISAFLFTLSGCNNSTNYIQERTSEADYTIEAERKSSLNQFEEKVSELKNLTARLKTESRDLMGKSSEGGEITRYTDDKGSVLRYNIKLYGEMGRSESDYFFDDEVIYYTGLQEEYTSPIYEPNSNVKSDVMERYMIKGGSCYQYDSGNDEYLLSDGVDMPYLSLQELEEEFSAAGEKREGGEIYSRYGIFRFP